MRNKFFVILFCILILINLTACYDAQEPTKVSFVSFVGIDRGVTDKYRLTIKIYSSQQNKDSGSVGGGGAVEKNNETEKDTITIDAPSFYAGINMLNTNIPHKLNFTHTTALIISMDLAESGLVGEFIAPLIRFRELRRTTDIIVVNGTSQTFIENIQDFLGENAAGTFESLLYESVNTGFFPHITLNEFYNALKSTYYQPIITLGAINNSDAFKQEGQKWGEEFNLPGKLYAGQVPRKGGNKVEFFGSAVFNKDKMVGQLDGYETRMLLLINGKYNSGVFTIQDPLKKNLVIPINLRLDSKPDTEVNFSENKINVTIKVKTEGDIYAIQSHINYEDPQMIKIIEKATTEQLEQSLNELIAKCQSYNSDVLGIGKHVTSKFFTIEELESYDWNQHFKDAVIQVEVEFQIRRTGGIIKSYPLEKT